MQFTALVCRVLMGILDMWEVESKVYLPIYARKGRRGYDLITTGCPDYCRVSRLCRIGFR